MLGAYNLLLQLRVVPAGIKDSLLSLSVMKFCAVSSSECMLVEDRIGLDTRKPSFQKWEFKMRPNAYVKPCMSLVFLQSRHECGPLLFRV